MTARRLRRRRAEFGLSRAQALSRRVCFRQALDAHWRLEEALGCHFAQLSEAIAAARLAHVDVPNFGELLALGSLAKHAAPPGAPAEGDPLGVRSGVTAGRVQSGVVWRRGGHGRGPGT